MTNKLVIKFKYGCINFFFKKITYEHFYSDANANVFLKNYIFILKQVFLQNAKIYKKYFFEFFFFFNKQTRKTNVYFFFNNDRIYENDYFWKTK